MALSQQDIITKLLLGDKGYFVDLGSGDGMGDPCDSNTFWLEEIGWRGLLLDYERRYINKSAELRPNSISVLANALQINYSELFKVNNVPKVIDYLSIDIEPSSIAVLKRFPFGEYDFKFLTIEHDWYNFPYGPQQKRELTLFMNGLPYRKIADDVGLTRRTTSFLEDWYVNPKYYADFKVKDIETIFYTQRNPNDIILDLFKKQK